LNSPFLFSPPSPFLDSWSSFNRCHFCICIHVYILFAPYSPSYPFPHHLPLSTSANPPNCFTLLLSDFVEEKNIKDETRNLMFCYVEIKMATQGVSLCCSHAYVAYSSSGFASFSPLHSSLVCFPWWPWPV
jgi:hypothetical protein